MFGLPIGRGVCSGAFGVRQVLVDAGGRLVMLLWLFELREAEIPPWLGPKQRIGLRSAHAFAITASRQASIIQEKCTSAAMDQSSRLRSDDRPEPGFLNDRRMTGPNRAL
ncbi:MAG: hypothetical protein ACU841_01405 [Gammaproteobacteria bacterium]